MDHRTWLGLNSERDRLRWAWQAFFDDYDIVLAPQTATPAMVHDHRPFSERTIEVDGATPAVLAADLLGGTARHRASAVHGGSHRAR